MSAKINFKLGVTIDYHKYRLYVTAKLIINSLIKKKFKLKNFTLNLKI